MNILKITTTTKAEFYRGRQIDPLSSLLGEGDFIFKKILSDCLKYRKNI